MGSTLITQVGTVTRQELEALQDPKPLGRRHGPVPHGKLVNAIRAEAERRGLAIRREEYALGRGGAALFGVMDFDRGWSEGVFALGFRASQDQTLALRAVAGVRVVVCDNLALFGSVLAFRHRHTTRLDLEETIALGFDRYETHAAALTVNIDRLRTVEIDATAAKEVIYDAVVEGVIPLNRLRRVHSLYFDPSEDRPDCAPRNLWGLHNAFTRAFKDFPPDRFWRAQQGLARLFGFERE